MIQPLTKRTRDGTLYMRPVGVEAEIEAAVALGAQGIQLGLKVTAKDDPGYISSECLVHLVRLGCRRRDQGLIGAALPVLLSRCEAVLRRKIPDGLVPDADALREDILGDFSESFARDGLESNLDELDFYECMFNRAFRTVYVAAIAHALSQAKHVERGLDAADDDASRRVDMMSPNGFGVQLLLATTENCARRDELVEAILSLPPKERDAVVLVDLFGYKEESEDPNEETAATRCKCVGRTIRNRLARAHAKLAHFEDKS